MEYRKHKPEPVQKGNPHGLMQRQHIFPRKSIERFYGPDGKVSVLRLGEAQGRIRVTAEHEMFCAKRVWDQRAELGYMAQIEKRFQKIANLVLYGDRRWLTLENDTVTAFYALWKHRAHYSANPVPAVLAKGVTPDSDLTKDKKERLESNHYLFIDENGMMGSRQLTGMHIQRAIDYTHLQLKGIRWYVTEAEPGAGEFLIPDSPQALYVPLSPTVSLLGNLDMPRADASGIRFLNLSVIAGCTRFAFARDFSQCVVR
ncbi:hypothetical protein [Burkholderia pseudomallei]|uniref:hypothetical protein n=2 Tax=Burkholderia pseudomallei TaxID=28450 RepID=UPI000AAB9639|nr:hypothetical protein [Burkholderia pseudomallei]MBY7653007.1 hypothetical protein [Burkholderia pseudomallei]MDV2126276.1 hypothetical protein [Burkholderia pseudomallei]MDV2230685.1 hypothetical protein [Burkholderia pseudomallei]QUN80296.1 hypothetical protein KEX45_15165 [Burkholderia pseudomallei]QUN86223.1 hypothetical protein KEX46_15380 [Burkholderia pseudomallei]